MFRPVCSPCKIHVASGRDKLCYDINVPIFANRRCPTCCRLKVDVGASCNELRNNSRVPLFCSNEERCPAFRRTQISMFRPIRMDHTNCLQVAIKSIQFNSIMFSCNGPFLSLSLSPTHKHTHAQTHTEEPGKKDGSQITDRGFLRVSEQAFKMSPIPRHTCVCDHKLFEG
jgi:hypothetical protein